MLGWKVFQEHRSVENEVATSTESGHCNEEAEDDPVGRSTGDNGEDAADQKRVVEGVLSANDIGAETPEECADKHACVDGDRETIGERWLELVASISSNDGLEEED